METHDWDDLYENTTPAQCPLHIDPKRGKVLTSGKVFIRFLLAQFATHRAQLDVIRVLAGGPHFPQSSLF